MKRHTVHLARSLLCTGCGLAPWKTLEHGKYAPRLHLEVEFHPPTNPFCTIGILC